MGGISVSEAETAACESDAPRSYDAPDDVWAGGGALAGITAPVAGLIAAWIAAGSVGLLGHPLSHALEWLALGGVAIAAWPARSDWLEWRAWRRGPSRCPAAIWLAGLVAAIVMTASSLPAINVMAPAVLLAAVAVVRPNARRALTAAASAVALFGVYRLANTSIPSLWQATDSVGSVMGKGAGWATGQPLSVGATFGGVDFLVLMGADVLRSGSPRCRRRAGALPFGGRWEFSRRSALI